MYEATKHHVEGTPLPDPLTGKASYYTHYVFNTSRHPHKQMTQEAHYAALKSAMTAADMPHNGQVTHKPRHEQALELRTCRSQPAHEVGALAGWNYSVMMQTYAQLPTGDMMSSVAGYGDRQYYLCVHALLDPSQMPEFQPMVEAFYPGIPAKLARLKEVYHYGPC